MAKKIAAPGPAKIGIIGGSGIYELEGLSDVKEIKVKTPFGDPSDAVITGDFGGRKVAFLPRHGRGHRIMPTEVNSQANIWALKSLGVERIISFSACGSLREDVAPKSFLIPDQLFDKTYRRNPTFFGKGLVGHVAFAEPYCAHLREIARGCAQDAGVTVHYGGTYVCMEGPQFSTKAESEVNRKLGFSVVGMTAMPEARLAREAEICYATVGLVTDYDVWKEGEEVTNSKVVDAIRSNVSNVKKMLELLIPKIDLGERKCQCASAARYVVLTQKDKINKATLKKLKLIVGKYI
jgi:5'-methylthioadenosine phosphorylase